MKKHFITGLVVLLPLTLTLLVVSFVLNLLTQPFLGLFEAIFSHYKWFQEGIGWISAEQLQKVISQVVILVLLFAVTMLLGFAARWVFFHYFIKGWEYLISKIPMVSTVYKACNDVIRTIFGSQSSAFKQVVLVPFPDPSTYSIGLVTRDSVLEMEQQLGKALVTVFVPTTPNPTSGFLMIYKKEDLKWLDMKVEDAFKYIISCGVIAPPFRKGEKL